MKKTNTSYKGVWKNALSFLTSLLLLWGNLGNTVAFAQDTQYYSADNWVVLAPTTVPTQSVIPDATVQAVADDITFSTLPGDESAIFGASLSVEQVKDDATVEAAKAAYTGQFAADGDAESFTFRLYRIRFSKDGTQVAVPANLNVNVFGSSQSGFTPVRAVPFTLQDNAAQLGDSAEVTRTDDAWQTAVLLPNTDNILLATRASGATPEPTETPATIGTYTYTDGSISLTATVGGSLPPEGAVFFVENLGDVVVPAQGADGAALQSLLAYHIGFRTSEGELGTDSPLSVHLDVNAPSAYGSATCLTNTQGDILWQAPDGTNANTNQSFDFSLSVGNSFILAGPQAAEPTPAITGPKTFTYEDDTLRLNVTVPDVSALPDGAELTANAAPAEWADYADRLSAQGVEEANVKNLFTITAAFTVAGEPVDTSAIPLAYDILLKGAHDEGALAWIMHGSIAQQADGFEQTTDGYTLRFTSTGESTLGFAVVGQPAAPFVYEDDTIRVTITAPKDNPLPENARLDATATAGTWAEYSHLLQKQGFDETRVKKLTTFAATFTVDGNPVDISTIPLTYTVLYKGDPLEGLQAWAIQTESMLQAETVTQTEAGAEAQFTLTGASTLGFAVTLPGRTVYTYEDDSIYVVATLSDPSAIPDGAELVVSPVQVDTSLQPYVDMMEQSTTDAATDSTAQAEPTAQPENTAPASSLTDTTADDTPVSDASGKLVGYEYSAYDIRFVLDGQEYEPAAGTVKVSITYKNQLPSSDTLSDVRVLHLQESDGTVNPVELPAQLQEQDGSDTITFDTNGFSVYLIANGYTMSSSLTYTIIDTTAETFTNTSYYNANRVLGVAGNFHLVAFATATLNAHTNGNILAKTLVAGSNFGTNNIVNELSYIQSYTTVNGSSASSTAHVLALGSGNTVSLMDNGASFAVNGTKLSKPYNIYQDNDTSVLPFVNLATVKTEVQNISAVAANYSDANVTASFSDMNNRSITVNTASGLAVYNTTASVLDGYNSNPINIVFPSGSTSSLIINVNCSGGNNYTLPDFYMWVGGTRINFSEVSSFTNGRVLFNFTNCNNKTITNKLMMGSMLAPGASVISSQNLNGTVVADNITINAESHRDDYIGKLTDNVSVKKVWKDADGNVLTGSSIPSGATATVQLYQTKISDNTVSAVGSAITLNSTNSYTYTWTGLDKVYYTYYVAETAVNGEAVSSNSTSLYTVTYTNNGGVTSGVITVTNQKKPAVSLAVSKVWKDVDGTTAFSGTTPAVSIQLKQNGNNYGSAVTLNSANSYTYTYSDLPKYSSGTTLYTYTVVEFTVPDGFDLVSITYGTGTATVTNKVESTSISATKTWSDGTATHPSVTINLLRNGSAYKTQTLPINTSTWNYTFTNLPVGVWTSATVYSAYTYTVTENAVTGYTGAVTGSAAAGFTVTNTLNTTSVTVTKTWSDPTANHPNVILQLTQDGTAMSGKTVTLTGSETTAWSYAFTGLPAGVYTSSTVYHTYVYGVTEPTTPTGYTQAVSGTTVTNTAQTTSITVKKTWNDTATFHPTVTLQLMQDGIAMSGKTVTLNGSESTAWTSTFTGLPLGIYQGTGVSATYHAYVYTVTEPTTPTGYTKAESGTTVTNTPTTTSATVAKTWSDPTANHPNVTLQLMQDGTAMSGKTITLTGSETTAWNYTFTGLPAGVYTSATVYHAYVYTVTEPTTPTGYTKTESGTGVTNTVQTTSFTVKKVWSDPTANHPTVTLQLMQDGTALSGKTVTLTGSETTPWNYTFTNLPLGIYQGTGASATFHTYVYTATEPTTPTGYTKAESGGIVTNTPATTSVTVNKAWNDSATVHPNVTLQLMCDGTAVSGKTVTLTGSETTPWNYTFTGLPQGIYQGTGASATYHTYVYTVTEPTTPTGYTKSEGVTTVTNTPNTTSISVTKTWSDPTANHPTVTLQLTQDGTAMSGKTVTLTGSETTAWSYTFAGLPVGVYTSSTVYHTYTYGVIEPTTPTGYTQSVSGAAVTNTAQTTSVSVKKVWNDAATIHPTVTLQLMQDGTAMSGKTVTLNGSESTAWTSTFTGLPLGVYQGTGASATYHTYVYTVTEPTTPTGYTKAESGTTVTNTPNTTNVTVTKTWSDEGGIRPSVTLQLLQDGTVVSGKTITLTGSETTPWSYTFTGLAAGVYTSASAYHAYVYTVTESTTPTGYTKVESGTGVTNTAQTTSITVTKTWAGDTGYTAYRPSTLSLTLKRKLADSTVDSSFSQAVTVTSAASWSTSVSGLTKGYYTVNGSTYTYHDFTYYITEPTTPAGYVKGESGAGITNTFQITQVQVTKVWLDDPDGDGTYTTPTNTPAVTVYVKNGATVVDSHTFAAGETVLTWTSKVLPKYDTSGNVITYTVTEDSVIGYALTGPVYGTYSGGVTATLTNTYQRVNVNVTKTWDFRSSSETPTLPAITYSLYQVAVPTGTDTPVSTVTVPKGSAVSAYNVSFKNLPKYNASGVAIPYSVTETCPQTYTTTRSGTYSAGFTFVNTLVTLDISGAKAWKEDTGNAYTGYRPAITISLLRNGVVYDSRNFAAVTSGTANYAYSFTNLPKYDSDGNLYTYTMQEPVVSGFTAVLSGYNLTNTLKTTSVKLTKVWNDSGFTGTLTHPAITVYLLNGVDKNTVANPADSYTFASGASSYEHTFTNLPVGYYDGTGTYHTYAYTVAEGSVYGYDASAPAGSAATGYTISNTLKTVSVSVIKNWVLATGITNAPEIVVTLKQDGAAVDSKTIAAGLTSRSDYSWTWVNLPKINSSTGNDYTYTVEEAISGGAATGFDTVVSYDRSTGGVVAATIVNTQKTVSLFGSKTWLDEQGNTYASGLNRPAFTVTLFQNGVKYAPEKSKAFAANATDLGYAFSGLPKYDASGNLYQYTVSETAVTGFTASYGTPVLSGSVITANVTNRLDKVSLSVDKQWMDNGTDVTDAATLAVTVQLTRKASNESTFTPVSGKTADLTSVTTPKYQATFADLPAGTVDSSGIYNAYTYSVAEQTIPGYVSAVGTTDISVSGVQNVTVTNTRGRIAFTVTKQWRAADSTTAISAPAGATVTVQLMQSIAGATPTAVSGKRVTLDGTIDAVSTAYESAAWTATFADLEQFTTGGEQISYSAVETASSGATGFWATAQSISATAYAIKNQQTALYVSKVSSVGGTALTGAAFSIINTTNAAESYMLTGSALISDWKKLGLATDTIYRLTETTTPKGYLTASDISFKIRSADGKVYVSTDGYATAQAGNRITVANEPIDLKVVKLNVNVATATAAELSTTYAGNFVTGAVLTLYASDNLTAALQTINVSANAFYTLDYNVLEKGKTYTLKETTTPTGYKTANPLTFTVGAAANGTIYVVYDAPITYKTIEVQKTWGTGSTAKDVTFDLFMNGGTTPIESVTLPAADSDGKIAFAGTASIAVGGKYPMTDATGAAITYAVTERAVDGYYVSSAMTQTADATTIHNAITNSPVKADFSKKALVGSDELPGATLTLTDVTSTPAQVEQWVSGNTTHTVTGKLIVGHTYTFAETTAPNGYAVTETVTFLVKTDGTLEAVGTAPTNTSVTAGAVTMRDKQLTLTISKKALGGGEELPGANLTLTDTTGNQTVATWVGGSTAKTFASTVSTSGTGTPIGGLYYTFPVGQTYPLIAGHSYKLAETAAPAGYLLANDITFSIAADGSITNVSANGENTGTTVTLRDEVNTFTLYKTDASGAKLPGATFALYLYSETAGDHLGARVFADQTIITDTNGSYTLHGMTNGQKYVLRETAAPAGYNLASDTVFTYVDSQQTVPYVSVTVADSRASMKLRKTNPQGVPVAGSTLAIYNADKTVKLWEGVSIASTGDNPEAWLNIEAALGQTDASRYLVKGGTYYLHEEAAPDGYVLRSDYVAFTFGEGGTTALSFADDRLTLTIGKVDIVGGTEIAGALLRITDDTDSGRLVEDWTTAVGTDGTVQPHTVEYTKLKAGHTYTLTELTAPDGYLHAESVQFAIANDGKVTLVGTNGSLNGTTVTMTDDRSSLSLLKTGISGAVITSGVGFTLYSSDAAGSLGTQIGGESLSFDRLVAGGYYWLEETTVPDGYVAMAPLHFQFNYNQTTGITSLAYDARTDIVVTTAANGKVAITMNDAPTSVTVHKWDENGKALAGAVLSIHADAAGSLGAEITGTRFTTQADNTATPEDESLHTYTGVLLRGQSYWLVEESAPGGYALAAPIRFTVNNDATTVALTMQNLPLELTLYKLDSDAVDGTGAYTGNKVNGITFTLTGPYKLNDVTESTHVWTWSTTSGKNPMKLTMTDGLVPGGTYILHEDPATVPETNTVASDMTFTLPKNGGTVTKVMVDAPVGGVSLKVTKAFAKAADGSTLTANELPASVTVNLMRGLRADGSDAVKVRSYALTAADSWTYTFAGLLKTDTSGATYYYTVTEDAVSGFTYVQTSADTDETDNYAYTITNKANEGSFSKRTIDNDELPGAHMQVLDTAGNVIAEWVSTDSPYMLRGKLNPNTDYVLKEVASPAGYLVTTAFTFHMDATLNATVTGVTYGGVENGIVFMKDAATTVTLSKQAIGGGSELEGASLTVTHHDANGTTVTDANWVSGTASKTIEKLLVGVEYTFTEVTQPNGFLKAESIHFILQPDGSVMAKQAGQPASAYRTVSANTVLMLDAPTGVTLSKQAVGGGAELVGASVTVTHDGAGGAKVTDASWISGKDNSGATTNLPKSLTGLTTGTVYTFTETTAPYGYAMAESIQFIINEDGTVQARKLGETTFVTVDAGTVIMKDAPTTVTFSKQAITGGAELPGAYLTLTDTTPVTDQPTTQWSWVSTDTQHVISGELIAGHTYTLTEITSPAGYTVAETITFTINANGEISATDASGKPVNNGSGVVDKGTGTVTMKDAPTVLTLTKVDDQTPVQIVTNAELSVYTATGADATTPGALVVTVNTGVTGTATVTGTLSLNSWYMIAETGTPDGYVTAQYSAPFQLLADGTKAVQLIDPRTLFYVGKRDVEHTDMLLAGATLVIYDSNLVGGVEVPDTGAVVTTITTLAGQKTAVYGLKRNHTYFLYEAGAPVGYLQDVSTYSAFTISDNGSTEVYSYDPQTTVKLNKTDATGANRLGGAQLILVQGDGVGYTSADIITSFTSSATTDYSVRGLVIGQLYTLLETAAPDGYVLKTTGVSFKLNNEGKVISATGSESDASTVDLVSLSNTPAGVIFSKRATGAGTAELIGATLTVSHVENGTTVMDDTWISGDSNNRDSAGNPIPHVITSKLKADGVTEYTFTEVGAPAGYTIAGSLVFRIETDGTVKVKQPDGSFTVASKNTVIMTDAPIRFKIAKVDNTSGAYLAGAEFKVVADVAGQPGTAAVTGFEHIVSAEAPVTVSGLPAGSYWLVETKAPVGMDANGDPVYYQLAAPVAFTLSNAQLADTQLVTVTVKDVPTTVIILKLDSLALDSKGNPTGNRVKDATITLTRKSDGALLGTHTFDGIADWVLDSGLLEPGSVYILNETVANTPDGYLTAYSQEFMFAADGSDRWVIVDDPIPEYRVVVNKQWNDSVTAHLPAIIDLYRSDNAATPYQSKTLVSPDAVVTFENLPSKGKDGTDYTYSVKEQTLAGYLPGVFTGPTVSTDGATFTYTLVNTPTSLIISKLAADTSAELPGAHLTLVKGDGTSYTAADVVESWTTGTDGTNTDGSFKPHTLIGKLTVGAQYTLVETAAPEGYIVADKLTFIYLASGSNSYNGTGKLTMTDQPVTLLFGKVDNVTGELVAGANFTIYNDAEWQANAATATPVYTFTSKTTLVEVKGLFTAGALYRLVETKAPDGYQINGGTLQFRAPADGTVVTIEMKNPRIYKFAKISASTGKAVPGATLEVTDLSGNVVITPWTSTGDPYEFVNSDTSGSPILKAGATYRLVEIAAPSGYMLNTTAVTFTLDGKGLISGGTTVSMTNTPQETPKDDTVDLTIRKTWVDNSNAGNTRPTGGLTVNVYRKLATETAYTFYLAVNVPSRTGNSWYLTIQGLARYNANGVEYNYRAREVIPTGYTVTYTNNGFTMVNTYPRNDESPTPTPVPTLTPTPSPTTTSRIPTHIKFIDGKWVYIDDNQVPLGVVPQTGDESNYFLWGLAIALPLLLAAIAGFVIYRRKRRASVADNSQQ